ncbi:MAG: branched-chain amino acid ABC transporter permease [Burkholderiaceae bacterium]|nr:branched-chain amino acid ABC transporter permease [Burkholderiaceae bacterium]
MGAPTSHKASGGNLRLIGLVILAAIAAWPWFSGPFALHLAVLTCLNILVVNGLAIIARTGQLSFGHAAFAAIGAYAAVILSIQAGWNILIAAVVGIALSAFAAFLLGWVILRLKGVYFVLVTFSFGELTRLAALDWSELTGGANGIANIAPLTLFGFAFDTRLRFYVLALVVAVLSLLLMRRLFSSNFGHAIDAVHENAALAESSGLSVHKIQLVAFVVGSSLAALGGILQARYIGFVSPESFNTSVSVAYITMLVIGGQRSVWGPLVGALVLTPLPEFFRGAVQTQHIFYGAALILILRFLPGGLASLATRFRRARAGAAQGEAQ